MEINGKTNLGYFMARAQSFCKDILCNKAEDTERKVLKARLKMLG